MAAGVVGALAYTSAIHSGSVQWKVKYMPCLLSLPPLVFWAMLKWEHADEHAGNDRSCKTTELTAGLFSFSS